MQIAGTVVSLKYLFYGALFFCSALFMVRIPALFDQSNFDWWDKAEHVVVFIVLGVIGFLAYPQTHFKLLVGLLVYGACIELAQSLTTWRQGDWLDWLANAIGVLLAWTGLLLFKRLYAEPANMPKDE